MERNWKFVRLFCCRLSCRWIVDNSRIGLFGCVQVDAGKNERFADYQSRQTIASSPKFNKPRSCKKCFVSRAYRERLNHEVLAWATGPPTHTNGSQVIKALSCAKWRNRASLHNWLTSIERYLMRSGQNITFCSLMARRRFSARNQFSPITSIDESGTHIAH